MNETLSDELKVEIDTLKKRIVDMFMGCKTKEHIVSTVKYGFLAANHMKHTIRNMGFYRIGDDVYIELFGFTEGAAKLIKAEKIQNGNTWETNDEIREVEMSMWEKSTGFPM
ncbi:MAG: hypothetical protein KAS32_05305 [Candidatus Peribacteraceae bacterium]|nr:hypothetical protein [Candidatus Peribacteraceae bacterium]